MMSKYVKITIAIVAVVVLSTAGYFIFPKSYILMSVAPDNVTVKIDGGRARSIKTGSTILVIAGKHSYTVARDGFETKTVTLESGNNETKELLTALTAKTDAAQEILGSDASQAVLQRINGMKMESSLDTINQKYPIVKELPIYARLYSIESCPSRQYPDDSSRLALCVEMSQSGLEPYVRKDIESRGYNPDDYEIIYSSDDTTGGSLDSDQ